MTTNYAKPDRLSVDVRKVRRGRRVRYVAWALRRSVLGEYPTAEDARKAGELMLAMNEMDEGHICTPADIDRVRKELLKPATGGGGGKR